MAFDFKKEYREFYIPKNRPEIVNVPKANYIAVRGDGRPERRGRGLQAVHSGAVFGRLHSENELYDRL